MDDPRLAAFRTLVLLLDDMRPNPDNDVHWDEPTTPNLAAHELSNWDEQCLRGALTRLLNYSPTTIGAKEWIAYRFVALVTDGLRTSDIVSELRLYPDGSELYQADNIKSLERCQLLWAVRALNQLLYPIMGLPAYDIPLDYSIHFLAGFCQFLARQLSLSSRAEALRQNEDFVSRFDQALTQSEYISSWANEWRYAYGDEPWCSVLRRSCMCLKLYAL